MAIQTFTSTEFEDVRAAIDLELTSEMLTDNVINRRVFEGEARRWINRNLTETVITQNLEAVKTAAVLYCAALILPSFLQVVEEDIAGGSIKFQNRDFLKLAAERRAQANDILVELQNANTASDPTPEKIPTFFTVAESGF